MASLTLDVLINEPKLRIRMFHLPELFDISIKDDILTIFEENNPKMSMSILNFHIFNPIVKSWLLEGNNLKINLELHEPRNITSSTLSNSKQVYL